MKNDVATGLMTKNDYDAVIDTMHLANGAVWTIPVTLAVSGDEAARASSFPH